MRVYGRIRAEFLVALFLIGVLATVLLVSLRAVQNEVERVLVAADLVTLRTELQLAVASAINRGLEGSLPGWAGRNPLELAGRPMNEPGVTGPGARHESQQIGGSWMWRGTSEGLVYAYADGGILSVRLVRVGEAGEGGRSWALGGGLLLVGEERNGR